MMLQSPPLKRCLVCVNPDLNLIDGSSIWAQTITLALAKTGLLQVDFIAKATPVRDELFQPLVDSDQVNVIDGGNKKYWGGQSRARLTPSNMVDLAKRLDEKKGYDLVLIRGIDIAREAGMDLDLLSRCWIYLTDIQQEYDKLNSRELQELKLFAKSAMRILYQSEGFAALWRKVDANIGEKLVEYSPVIPDLDDNLSPISQRKNKVVYAGKYCKDWKTLDMAVNWPKVHNENKAAELLMIGDLIRSEKDDRAFKEKMLAALENTEGLTWCGALPRLQVKQELAEAKLGLSWRSPELDKTVEYSTKILEYGGAGAAAILNRNPLHESMLGTDYPLYANSEEEFISKVLLALQNDEVCQLAADRLKKLAEKHTFSNRVDALKSLLEQEFSRTKVLVAGHDLKFFGLLQRQLESTGKYQFIIDKWQGHNKHIEADSKRKLLRADIIFCEWCLGNLKWYSKYKLPHQKLVARFHLQEKDLPYLSESAQQKIDHIAYVSDQIKREANEVVPFPAEKSSVIANLMDEDKYKPIKKMADAEFTLGMIGIAPSRKRVDLAIDVLEELLKTDSRYRLRIKGTHPFDYPWLAKREEELEYYMDVMERINAREALRYAVTFDPPGDDVNEWLSLVGYILSPSDFESFHLAVGEGMLTNAVPIVWDWPGSNEIWPQESIVSSTAQAVEKIKAQSQMQSASRDYVLNKYGVKSILCQWENILSDSGSKQ